MAKDISRHTLVALVALAIVVSLLGTFTVFSEVSNYGVAQQQSVSTASGQVKLEVASMTKIPQVKETSGDVQITIIR